MKADASYLVEQADKGWFNVVLAVAVAGLFITLGRNKLQYDAELAAVKSQAIPPIVVKNARAYFDEHGDLIYESDGSDRLKTCPAVQLTRELLTETGSVVVEAVVVSGTTNKVGDVLPGVRTIATEAKTSTPAARLRVVIPPYVARSQIKGLIGTQGVDSGKPCVGDENHEIGKPQQLYRLLLGGLDNP